MTLILWAPRPQHRIQRFYDDTLGGQCVCMMFHASNNIYKSAQINPKLFTDAQTQMSQVFEALRR